jgi:hypothetical protein
MTLPVDYVFLHGGGQGGWAYVICLRDTGRVAPQITLETTGFAASQLTASCSSV